MHKKTKTVLLIGQHGQVSTYLQRVLSGDYKLLVAGREQLDLANTKQIQSVLESIQPSVIINPAAFTAVDLAEQEADLAYKINRDAVKQLALYAAKTNTPLIHFSTDYVFDGLSTEPYTELVSAAPTGVYGKSKLQGEQAILESGAPALILRTSWVYSNTGKNFYKTMLSLAQSRNELSVVADQIGSPTYAGSIAWACKELLDTILLQGQIEPTKIGVYHFTCQGQTSWCEFAKAIFTANQRDDIAVNGITTAEYPTPAARPPFSVLNNQKLKTEFNLALPHWQDALIDCVAETKSSI
jgi:dTDP-4-dehydrorhamnose reductase